MKFFNLFHVINLIFVASSFFLHSTVYATDVIPDDISAWTEQGTVLTYGVPGSWDEKERGLYPVGVHKINGTYYLHYLGGFDGCWTVDGGMSHRSVGLATSSDGVNFTKFSKNPVLKPHDFVPVHSHEEGIRTSSIRYLPQKEMWLGYFGVESPGGADTCPFMGSEAQCSCNVEVDSSIYAATSLDGKNWAVQGEVQGVYNDAENYVDDFQYINGEYYLWSHRAQGGQKHHASKGSDYMSLTPLGVIPKWCWGWSELSTYVHKDGKTVTAIYDPNGGCAAASKNDVYFATTSLDNMTVVTNERVIAQTGRISRIFQDIENGIWRWYYNGSGAKNGTIQLRTHPITADPPIAPTPPSSEKLLINLTAISVKPKNQVHLPGYAIRAPMYKYSPFSPQVLTLLAFLRPSQQRR